VGKALRFGLERFPALLSRLIARPKVIEEDFVGGTVKARACYSTVA
jgi:hypothetical protein